MNLNTQISRKYKKELPNLILANYGIIIPVFVAILIAFCFTDIYIRKIPPLVYTRVLPIILLIILYAIRLSKLKTKSNLVVIVNNLSCISIIMMGFLILIITFNTEVFRSSINAVIIFSFVVFFGVKGKTSIWIVYLIPLLFIILYIIFILQPDLVKLQELMNPLAIYIAVVMLSFANEKSRFAEFYYKESLIDEKEKTEDLYHETSIQNKELHQQKEEILSINEQLEQRKEELQINLEVISDLNNQLKSKNKSITDSINYARRIQDAILPSEEKMGRVLNDYFVLYKPCDIVSGDFYWMHTSENYEIIAAVDCTGHGVPGGFMSMLGFSLLNDVVQNSKQIKANEILNRLKDKLKESLNQNNKNTTQADGLDIALCVIDKKKSIIQFSGAYMPFTVLRNNELIHLKGDKMPIGRYIKEIPSFTNHELSIEDGDSFYLYSDGFQDQMGGAENKRFLSNNLKKLILEIGSLSFNEQKLMLDETIESWKGKNQQMDDIMVIGFKLK